MNEFNNMNDNEEKMLKKILEMSLKEYDESQQKNKESQINNNNDNLNKFNNNIINNNNYIQDKKDNNVDDNNLIINNMINNNIIKDDIIDCSDCNPHDSKNDNEIDNIKESDKISNNSKKGLFEDLNPVPLQNHLKNDDFNLNEI